MSTEPPPSTGRPVPTMFCGICETDVPAGTFCGHCGAELSAERGDGRGRLRLQAYSAAPAEHVLRLSLVSSLFPHLPQRSRTPFRAGLAVLLATLAVFALLRWQAPLIAVTALGLPLLFLIYLYEVDAYRDLSVPTVLLIVALGVGLGVGWALFTGTIVARSYDLAIGSEMTQTPTVLEDVAIPLGGAALMLLPAVLARLLHPPTRESLDGFLVGSLGAIAFTAATTLTLLAPQLATGPTARSVPAGVLFIEAGIRGIAMPLTAAAVGGMFGAALWFAGPASGHRYRWLALRLPVAVAVVLVVYAGLGLIDVAPVPQSVQLALHLVVAAMVVLGLRIWLQAALLHEAHDPVEPGEPLLCQHCAHVVPDMAFCPACGVATRASSRSSRTARRSVRPQPIDRSPENP